MSFDEVIGQKEAEERLLQLVREERLPHALMLCGPQGCGKLPLAVAFACYLLPNWSIPTCTSPTPPSNCHRWVPSINQ